MFNFYKSNGRPNGPDIVQLPAGAGSFADGDALVVSAGAAAKATGTTRPTHVCAETKTIPAGGASTVSAYRALPGSVFKTRFSADGSAVKVGELVTIAPDAAQVTATTTGGVARVENKLGDGSTGTFVLVSF